MSDALYNEARFKRGGGQPIKVSCATEVKVGDFCVLVSSKATRVSTLGDSGTLAQNQEAAHDIFLGTALDQNINGATKDILIQPDGEHCYPCAALSQAYDVGQLFGIAGTGTANAVGMADQIVVPVAAANLAIGKLTKPAASGDTKVWLNIAAPLGTTFGGTQTPA